MNISPVSLAHACGHMNTDPMAAGVDFEEAGEKWRGGDAAKVGQLRLSHHVGYADMNSPRDSSFEQLIHMKRA